ncbi:hypothetical protein B0T10DRAFT_459961 [Thelonectria olida]|uniref:Uncharacterized protein n=1 Tax=Thelonectria olida TaxID=1576542 RepID=A0A9P8W685_9HYPO|nr:hypothetical protein B0T10DRAFT_459961 [Thelonectria olida]
MNVQTPSQGYGSQPSPLQNSTRFLHNEQDTCELPPWLAISVFVFCMIILGVYFSPPESCDCRVCQSRRPWRGMSRRRDNLITPQLGKYRDLEAGIPTGVLLSKDTAFAECKACAECPGCAWENEECRLQVNNKNACYLDIPWAGGPLDEDDEELNYL